MQIENKIKNSFQLPSLVCCWFNNKFVSHIDFHIIDFHVIKDGGDDGLNFSQMLLTY